jgi:hypothetical protein
MTVPVTRQISWQQLCVQADPEFYQNSIRPWIYDFSNGRLYYQQLPVYSTTETGTNSFLVHV